MAFDQEPLLHNNCGFVCCCKSPLHHYGSTEMRAVIDRCKWQGMANEKNSTFSNPTVSSMLYSASPLSWLKSLCGGWMGPNFTRPPRFAYNSQ